MGDSKKEKKFRGLDVPTLSYFCGDDSWRINPQGHLPKIADKLEKLVTAFEKITEELKSGKMADKVAQLEAQGNIKEMLALSLLPKGVGNPKGFDFDEALEKYGYRTLDGIAIDLKRFLLDIGGVEEYKLSRQRLKEIKDDGFHSIEA